MIANIRRNALYASLVLAAFSTAAATAIAIPSVEALAQEVIRSATPPADLLAKADRAKAAAAAKEAAAVSPRMADLVEMYEAVSANIDSLDPNADPAAWTAAEEAWMRAEANLVNEPPRSVCDLSAKFDALLDIENSEGEYARLKRLSEDVAALGGCAK